MSLIALALILNVAFVFAQKREVKVETFSKLSLSVPGTVHLRQGSPQKVEVDGSKEMFDKIEFETDGNKLKIISNDGLFNWGSGDEIKVNIYVTVEHIDGISVNGSGQVVGENKISASDLELKLNGSGSLQIDASVTGALDIAVSGSGNVKVTGSCKDLESQLSGSGRIEIASTINDVAEFSISGSGKINAQGTANTVKASVSGSGKLLAADLEALKCTARIAGSGDVEINVKNDLDAQISGSGNVSYKGNPAHLNSKASGSGKIRKL